MMTYKKEYTSIEGVNFTAIVKDDNRGYIISNDTGIKKYFSDDIKLNQLEKFIEHMFNVNNVYSLNDFKEC